MYRSNVNLNLYKVFYEVAKHKSITETAKKTYTSQPAVSKSIKKLEEELGTKLFYRTLSGIELTEKGKELYFFVEQGYNSFVTAERAMVETENLEKGKLSIGMPSNIGSFFLFDKTIDFHNKYPNIEITIITGSTTKLMNLLDSHKVDFVIDTSPINVQDKDVIVKELITVDYCFVVNKNTKIKKISAIKNIKDLESSQLILPIPGTSNRNELDKLLLKNNVKINDVINIHTSEMILSAIKKDLGIGYVIKDLVEYEVKNNEIKILDIKQKLPNTTINLVYKKAYLTKAPTKFIKDYIENDIKK